MYMYSMFSIELPTETPVRYMYVHVRYVHYRIVCIYNYLQRHLPGPGVRNSLFTVDDTRISCDDWSDGRRTTAWRERHTERERCFQDP